MDPQAFIRLSIGCLGIRQTKPGNISPFPSPCSCEIRLRGFRVQTTPVPFIPSPETAPNSHKVASSFYLEESDLKALLASRCFHGPRACLEIAVFTGRKSSHCGVGSKRQQIGVLRLSVGPEWGEGKGKPTILFNGWIGIGKGHSGTELHLRVKLEPDPRYMFQFEDKTKLSPQVVQLQGIVKQPIFSCKFSRDSSLCQDNIERRERKGWKVKIHDLSGSAVAAAFITTPFVPSMGCDWVVKSNPGAWLIVRPDPSLPESWLPWGKLEAWRERGQDSICFRFHVFSECGEILISEVLFNADKGGEFFIDTDSGEFGGLNRIAGGFVMSCRVQGEGKSSRPSVQLAMRHVTCVEDAAIFMALAAAVDLSMEVCRPFRRKIRIGKGHPW